MKIPFIILMTLFSVSNSFSQNLLLETDIQIQRFGKETYYKDKDNNLLNGHFKIADNRGNYSDVIFKEGKKDGESTDYDYAGRVIKTREYRDGRNYGTYKTYHQNGNIETTGVFLNGEQNGKWETFNNKGITTRIEHYDLGKKTGKWEEFNKEGKPIRIEQYLDGQKTGKWWSKKYYATYNFYTYEIEHYKKNQRVGHAEEKKEDGSLRWERDYINNDTYTHKEYYSNGTLAKIYHIKNSKTDKERISYNEDGSVKKQELFKDGDLLKSSTEYVVKNKKPERGAKPKPTSTSVGKKISDFNYKALLISNENYNDDVGKLDSPISDAEKLKGVLLNSYNFKEENVIHLKDATRFDIINTLDSLTTVITPQDNLLIFYAGHGVFDTNLNKGYWLPVDASATKKNNWVSNSDIRDYITAIKSQHTLLISDACFSGSIFEFKQRSLKPKEEIITEKLLSKKSRKAMTSGLNKTVPDKSFFVKFLIKSLTENSKSYLRAGELYNDIREAVISNTDNNPQFEVIKNSNHEGGEFIFLKK